MAFPHFARPADQASGFAILERLMTFARIGIFDVPPHQLGSVVALFRDQVTPAFATHDGFLGYQAFSVESDGRMSEFHIGPHYQRLKAAPQRRFTPANRRRSWAPAS